MAAFVVSATIGCATAQSSSGGAVYWSGAKDCIGRDVGLPSSGAYVSMAQACEREADDPNASGGNTANAAYNAARAYNASAAELAASDPARVSNYVKAVAALRKSLDRLKNDHPSLTTPTQDRNKKVAAAKDLANRRFRLGRVYELAQAYSGLGLAEPPVSAQAGAGACVGRDPCLMAALEQLGNKDLAGEFANDPADVRYDAFIFLRGKTYSQLGRAGDSGQATADLEEIIRRGSAPGASQARTQLASDARLELAKITLKGGQAALLVKTRESQGNAIGFFQKALVAEPSNMQASAGLGDAYIWLARDNAAGRRDNYSFAAKAYGDAAARAVDLRRVKDEPALIAAEANARDGRAQALEALIEFDVKDGPDAVAHRDQAIAEYRSAAGLEPASADRQLKLARAYGRAKDDARADETYKQAIDLLRGRMPATAAQLSAALLEVADIRSKLSNYSPDDVRRAYTEAIQANPQSARPYFEVARNFFNQVKFNDAETYFKQVIQLTGGKNAPPAPADVEYKADANYYLSRIYTERTASPSEAMLKEAVEAADAAVTAGGVLPRHREQACVSRILRGKESVTAVGASNFCAVSNQPEGLLMRGMFALRQAQYSTAPQTKAAARETAQIVFDLGLREATRPGATVGELTFKVPGSEKAPPVRDLLEFGKAVVIGCSGLSGETSLGMQELARAKDFFEFYKVYKCQPN